jgi:hypothetical protein
MQYMYKLYNTYVGYTTYVEGLYNICISYTIHMWDIQYIKWADTTLAPQPSTLYLEPLDPKPEPPTPH